MISREAIPLINQTLVFRERPFELAFHLLGMVQGLVADFHENMDAVAVEGAVEAVERALFRDEGFDAAVLLDVHGTVALPKGEGGPDNEYGEANDAFHNMFLFRLQRYIFLTICKFRMKVVFLCKILNDEQ